MRDGSGLAQVAAAPNGDLYAVWQDARASGGQLDGIVLTRSADAGLTWSTPVQVNAVPAAQAFTPTVHVLSDGTVDVSYYDLRSDTIDPSSLPTELWLARSTDGGTTWDETRVAGPFDLLVAPNARGLFLGDYQGLTSVGADFVAFFAQTTRAGAANPNDIFARPVTTFARAAARNPPTRIFPLTARGRCARVRPSRKRARTTWGGEDETRRSCPSIGRLVAPGLVANQGRSRPDPRSDCPAPAGRIRC